MHHILKKANGDFSDVVKTTILMKDMNDFQAVNKIYGKYFTNNLPARMAFQVYPYSSFLINLMMVSQNILPYYQILPILKRDPLNLILKKFILIFLNICTFLIGSSIAQKWSCRDRSCGPNWSSNSWISFGYE